MKSRWYAFLMVGAVGVLEAADATVAKQAPSQDQVLFNELKSQSSTVLHEISAPELAGREQVLETTVSADKGELVRAFKKERAVAIMQNIANLRAKREAAEAGLREKVKKTEDEPEAYLGALAHWAKINAALQEEEEVLAFVEALPDNIQDDEIKLAIKQTDSMQAVYGSIDKDYVRVKSDAWQAQGGKGASANGLTVSETLKGARDAMAAYYEVVGNLYRDANQMIEGLWLVAAADFEAGKDAQIAEQLTTPGEELSRLRTQRAAIWQGVGDKRILGKRELVEQRKADLDRAVASQKEARKQKGDTNDAIAAASEKISACRAAYEQDRGRLATQEMLLKAHEDLRIVIGQIRDIDENTPEQTEKSRIGLKVLKREAALVATPDTMGGGSKVIMRVASVLGKRIGAIKEIEPVRSEFELRMKHLEELFPQIKLALAGVRLVGNVVAPGLLKEV